MERWHEENLHGHYFNCLLVDIIKSKGIEKIKIEELTEELVPKGKALIPESVKSELLEKIQMFIDNDPDYKRLYDF